MRKCRDCGETDLEKLVVDNARPFGRRNECKDCRKKAQRGGKIKNNNLKRTYGINLTQYNQILKEQNNKCKICKRPDIELTQALHVDHCHSTGKVRGLLCFNCNQGLGNFKDSLPKLAAAFEYLITNG